MALCLAAAVVGAGCGGGSSGGGQSQELSDAPAPLPAGWRTVVNDRAGFSFGLPPGWRERASAQSTLVRSRDRALAGTIAADRSKPGRSMPLDAYARQTIGSLRGYRGLGARPPTKLNGGHYEGVTLRATGVFQRTGVAQRIELFALRRPGVGTFTLLFFRSARTSASRYAAVVRRIVRSLRTRAPGSGG